jgi:uncharacterized protein (TIGR03084 family)
MLQESLDLLAEAEELRAFLETLRESDWQRETGFMGWTPWDVVAHLHFFDQISLVALAGREAFATERDALMANAKRGRTNQQIAREKYGELPPRMLLERWHETCHEMSQKLGSADPKARLRWFGPDMGVRMFTTARFMETWAHGQEIYDLMRVARKPTDRIRHVAAIGVRTFGWSFANRGLPVPGPAPYVRLDAPSGAVWEYGERSETSCVSGSALEFCHVVTQGRNIADTSLEVVGDVAQRWMAIAQCFAGGPVDPPKPGTRSWS